MTEDFNKVQKQLMSATKREADLQESLTIMVIRYYETDFIKKYIYKLSKLCVSHLGKRLSF